MCSPQNRILGILPQSTWLLIALLACLIQVGSYQLFELNNLDSFRIRTDILHGLADQIVNPISSLREYRGRIYWEGSYFLLLCSDAVALGWGFRVIVRCHQTSSTGPVLLTGLLMVILEIYRLSGADEHSAMFNNIFATSFDWISHSPLVAPSLSEWVLVLISVVNVLSVLVSVTVLVAICCAVKMPRNADDLSFDYYVARDHFLDQGVLVGSIVMLFGMIHMGCWLEWPIAILDESESKKNMLGVNASIYQYWGIVFSVMLFSVYGLATLYWHGQIKEYLKGCTSETQDAEWIRGNGFGFSMRRHLPQIVAVLAPIIAGLSGGGSNLISGQ